MINLQASIGKEYFNDGIIAQVCKWISSNPTYVIWLVCIGIICFLVLFFFFFKQKSNKKKISKDYYYACCKIKQLSPLSSQLDNANKKIKDLEMDNNRLVESQNNLSRRIGELNASIKEKDDLLFEKNESLKSSNDARESLRIKLKKADAVILQNQKDGFALKSTIGDLEQQIVSINEDLKTKETELASLNEQLQKKESAISKLEKELSDVSKIIENQNIKITEYETRLQNIPNVTQLKEEIELYVSKLQETTAKLDSKELALSEALSRVAERGDTIRQLQGELKQSENQVAQLKERIKMMEEQSIPDKTPEVPNENINPKQEGDYVGEELSETIDVPVCEEETQSDEQRLDSNDNETDEQKTTDERKDVESSVPRFGVSKKRVSKSSVEENEDEDVDLPTIEKSTGLVKRSILQVIDVEHEEERVIDSDVFFNEEPEHIAHITRMLAEAAESGREAYVCACCMTPVKISKRDFGNKEVLFFSHCRRDVECEWKQDHSRNVKSLLNNNQYLIEKGDPKDSKEKYKKIKELIISSLNSERSIEMGVSDVEENKRIKSNYPFLHPRIAGIYARFAKKNLVFELQTRSALMNTVINKDIFYRLNDHHVIWIFGADEGSGYDYIKKHVQKTTMFANKRNVFIIDKEAMAECEKRNELVLKCNYLDPDNKWHYRMETTGNNGILITLDNLQFDEDMCKPYFFDANIEFFKINPEAEKEYYDSIVNREKLLKDLKDTYEGKIAERRRKKPIENSPITKEPDPEIIETEFEDRFLYFHKGKYGIIDDNKEFVIPCQYDKIVCWTHGKYRVLIIDQWGVIDENQQVIVEIKYKTIGDLVNGRANVQTSQETYVIDELGNRLADESIILQNGWVKFRQADKWGIKDETGKIIVECVYDEIGSFRSRLIGFRNGDFQKLTPMFEYRMKMRCVCSKNVDGRALYNIKGLVAKESTKKTGNVGLCYNNKRIANIIYTKNNKTIFVSDISKKSENKKFDHVDNDYDFMVGETLTGVITSIVKNQNRWKFNILFKDNRISYFMGSILTKVDVDPSNYTLGQTITLKKIGFDSNYERTLWKFIE